MVIRQLNLENFRNYKKRAFEFSPQTNLIVGPNTSGKTNLLEAIFLLSSGNSPRAGLDREMIYLRHPTSLELRGAGGFGGQVREGAEFALVSGKISNTSEVLENSTSEVGVLKELEVQLIASKSSPTLTTKKFKINGVAKRLGDFLPEFHVALFSPEDLNLVAGSPDLRRRFLDFALSNVDPRYRRAVVEYDKVRKRRNRLLERINSLSFSQNRREDTSDGGRKDSSEVGELSFWDAKLLEFGTFIQDARKKFFDEINSYLKPQTSYLKYLLSGLTAERLYEYRSREIAAETTLIGPHRDDFCFLRIDAYEDRMGANNDTSEVAGGTPRRWSNLARFGSRSEQRRAVLALKKAELEFVERKIGDRPILLLDDIFSELDEENRAKVSELFGEGLPADRQGQTIITTADINHIPEKLQRDLKVTQL